MAKGCMKHRLNRMAAISVLVSALFIAAQAVTGPPAVAGAVSKTFRQSIARKLGKAQAGTLSKAEAAALRRELMKLDKDTLDRIARVYGKYIPENSMRAARSVSTRFYSHDAYQAHLKKMYPDMTAAQRKDVTGNTEMLTYVDKNQPLLPRVVAHERLHQLSEFVDTKRKVGMNLHEGMTEFLARRVYGDMSIKGLPIPYPRKTEVVEVLAARVGKERIAKAYFRGGKSFQVLKEDFDEQLGRGAFDAFVEAMKKERYGDAIKIIKRGVLY